MNDSTLMTKIGTGSQTTTSSPQQSKSPANVAPTNASSLQSGTATSVLSNNKSGIELGGSALTYVNIAPRTAVSTPKIEAVKQAPSAPAVFLAGLLLLVAGVMLWNIIKAGKKTT